MGGREDIPAAEKRYPFSAVVGQESLRTALLLNAVDPSIGGVLIRGEKGTGKSTAARALAQVLPSLEAVDGCPYRCEPGDLTTEHEECRRLFEEGTPYTTVTLPAPFVELPLNASEDRVAGTIHFEHTLSTGRRSFEPGLLASANRGVLYVDEVNLLEDHLVDLLLDAAATGKNRVEREGISQLHPSRFILVGTMNPEEGELRPQFLDRFGLCVTVSSITDPSLRREITSRRISYERDPLAFIRAYREQEETLSLLIKKARETLKNYTEANGKIEESAWSAAAAIAARSRAQGHRADIILIKAACAFSALLEKEKVRDREVYSIAPYALAHRAQGEPEDTPESMGERIRKIIEEVQEGKTAPQEDEPTAEEPETYAPVGRSGEDDALHTSDMQIPGSAAAGSILFEFLDKKKAPRR
ncbi:MAG: ATP-binding protein [Spirochaetaceae bacterium]